MVVPWVIGRRLLDDNYCWNVIGHEAVYYLVRIPTIITVLVSRHVATRQTIMYPWLATLQSPSFSSTRRISDAKDSSIPLRRKVCDVPYPVGYCGGDHVTDLI